MLNKQYNITVTTTATIRPEIFKQTIDSFSENMFNDYKRAGHKLNLVLNIDPVGHKNKTIDDFMPIVHNRFDKIILNAPTKPSFSKAFRWVWNHIDDNTNFVFNLEDDWELLQKVDLLKLINILESEPDLAILRLAMFHADKGTMKNWNKFFSYNGKYYECPEELKGGLGFCGHPSLIKRDFVKNTVRHIDKNRNPEKQYHSRGRTPIMEEVMKWRYGVWSVPGSKPLIRDIGRKWIVENGFRKQGSKAFFTIWEKV